MNCLSALLWIMALLCEVLIKCLTWISEAPLRKSHLSVQVQRNITSLLLCLYSTSLFLAASPRSSPSFQETVTLHYAVSSAASSFGPWVAEQQQEELESAWAVGSLTGRLSPRPANKVVWLSGPGAAHAVSWPGQTPELFHWACLDEIFFFSRCFGKQPKVVLKGCITLRIDNYWCTGCSQKCKIIHVLIFIEVVNTRVK